MKKTLILSILLVIAAAIGVEADCYQEYQSQVGQCMTLIPDPYVRQQCLTQAYASYQECLSQRAPLLE